MVGEVLASAPQTIIDINVVKENRKACLRTNAGADPAIVRAVKDLLARNRFIVVDNPELAELEIAVSAESRRGRKAADRGVGYGGLVCFGRGHRYKA